MKPGVRAEDIVVGTGDEAMRGKVAVVTVHISLLDGTDLSGSCWPTTPMRIDLGKRDCIAGLRYGIEGMRVGGRRTLTISPHLAYRAQGVPGKIPPNAALRCEVELLEVREHGVVKPEDYPPGKHLIIGWLGDLQNGVAKWQFGLHDDGRYGAMVWVPIPGLKWRHNKPKVVEKRLTPERAATLIESAVALPNRFPLECLSADKVCVDHSGHDGGVHRNRETDALCLAVTLWERGQCPCQYYIAETSPAWMTTGLHEVIRDLIAPVVDSVTRSRT
ncbi:MAG: FKBP-type peptidyl-prolyl cis-trans isomerase [bacterium]